MKAVGEPDAGNLPVRLDERLMGNAISLLYQAACTRTNFRYADACRERMYNNIELSVGWDFEPEHH